MTEPSTDMSRALGGAPALRAVFVVSLPEGRLLKAWPAEAESAARAVSGAAAALIKASQDSLQGLGAESPLARMSLEAEDRLLIFAPLDARAAAGFFFDRSAPIGLARVQARQLARQLRAQRAEARALE